MKQGGWRAFRQHWVVPSTLVLLTSLAVDPAPAQQRPPASVAPGRVEQPFQPPLVPPPSATAEPVVVPPGLAPAQAPPGAAEVRFVLRQVAIDGATAMSPGDLAPLYSDLVGKDVTLQQVYDVAAAITAKYGASGYILSQAVVPAQRISGGVVHIQVVEGYVSKVTLKDEAGNPVRESLLQAYAAKIAWDHPLRASDLERYLLLMNDVPGTTARAFMQPAPDQPGAAELVIVVSHKLVDGSLTVDNRGTRFIGPYQATAQAYLNDVTGLGERTGLRGILAYPTHDLKYLELAHDMPIFSEGMKVTLGAYASDARPGFTEKGLHDIDYSGSLQVSYPWVRSRALNIATVARFEVNDFEQRQNGALLSVDQLRVGRLQGAVDWLDTTLWTTAVNQVTLQGSQGFVFAGASASNSPNLSRFGADPGFSKVTGTVLRQQPLGLGFEVLVAGAGQHSTDVLPTSELFGFGGAEFGRGYDPSEITGDSGLAGKAELRWGQALGTPWLSSYQLYGFYDTGIVWNNAQVAGFKGEEAAASTGAGARASLAYGVSGYVEMGVPLTRVVAARGNKSPRVFFGVTGKF